MPLPLPYVLRNLWVRRLTTLLTAIGLGLVVFVFATVLMLQAGLREALVSTGQPDNVMVIRAGSQTEVQSAISLPEVALLQVQPQVAPRADGGRWLSPESLVLIALTKDKTGQPSNVTVRGTTALGLALRPQVRLVAGRLFRAGSTEIVVSRALQQYFRGVALGASLRFAQRDWRVVGVFEAGHTAYASELWGDVEQMRQAFNRPAYSAVLLRLAPQATVEQLAARLKGDPRSQLEFKPEPAYYAEQSELMATFLTILGLTLTVIFSLGAMIGAMITLYASVASRVGEIGTLRALGFQRRDILLAFLLEAMLQGAVGGVIGLLGAAGLAGFEMSTMNWQTFAELSFRFRFTVWIALGGLLFAMVMGLLGGVLPAWRAARLNIVEALRAE